MTSPLPNAQPKESKITTLGPNKLKKPINQHPTDSKIGGGGVLLHHPVKSIPAYLWRLQTSQTAQTPKPESSSFWPGFLDFFSGSQENKVTPRPILSMSLPPFLDKQPTLRPGIGNYQYI